MSQQRGKWTSASSAHADRLCPARHLMQQQVPETESTKDSEFGDAVHQALAKQGDPEIKSIFASLALDQQETFEVCCEIELQKVSQFFSGESDDTPIVTREKRLWIGWKGDTGELWHSGQSDVCYEVNNRALIADYKSLWGEVPEPASNEQLRDLACILFRNRPNLTEIGVFVIQPRVTKNPDICVYTSADLARATNEMAMRVIKSNTPGRQPVPGDEQCHFCRAKKICKPWQDWTGEHLPAQRPLFDVPIQSWTMAQKVLFCEVKGRINDWIEEGEKEIKRSLKADPESVPGFGVRADFEVQEVSDPQKCFERLEKLGVTLDNYMACLSVGNQKLLAAIKAVTGKKGKELEAIFKVVVDGITKSTKRSGGMYKKGKQ